MDHQRDALHLNPDSPVSFNATYPTKGQNVPVTPQPIPKHAAGVGQCLPAGAPGRAEEADARPRATSLGGGG